MNAAWHKNWLRCSFSPRLKAEFGTCAFDTGHRCIESFEALAHLAERSESSPKLGLYLSKWLHPGLDTG